MTYQNFSTPSCPAGSTSSNCGKSTSKPPRSWTCSPCSPTPARRHGKLLAVNDRADIAVTAGADVLHLGQQDLSPTSARRIVGKDMIIGLSSHNTTQAIKAAHHPDIDYFCLGPIWATPTKPGRPHTGITPIQELADQRPTRPWFGIGGIDEANLEHVLAAGATRIVVVRAINQAQDPHTAAAQLAARLAATTTAHDHF